MALYNTEMSILRLHLRKIDISVLYVYYKGWVAIVIF